jgi:hypothetical protein
MPPRGSWRPPGQPRTLPGRRFIERSHGMAVLSPGQRRWNPRWPHMSGAQYGRDRYRQRVPIGFLACGSLPNARSSSEYTTTMRNGSILTRPVVMTTRPCRHAVRSLMTRAQVAIADRTRCLSWRPTMRAPRWWFPSPHTGGWSLRSAGVYGLARASALRRGQAGVTGSARPLSSPRSDAYAPELNRWRGPDPR